MARERAAAVEEKVDTLAWMATFSDLLTLLLTFFVLIISMSSMDNRTLRQTFGFFKDAMGVLDKVAATEVHRESPLPINAIVANQIVAHLGSYRSGSPHNAVQVAQAVDRMIDQHDLEDILEARPLPGGLVLAMAAGVLFPPGSDRLRPDAGIILAALADLLLDGDIEAEVQGRQSEQRTDIDAWQLAASRSLAVAGYLMHVQGVRPRQLAVAAYGPGWQDDTLPGRAEKINIVLTWHGQEDGEGKE